MLWKYVVMRLRDLMVCAGAGKDGSWHGSFGTFTRSECASLCVECVDSGLEREAMARTSFTAVHFPQSHTAPSLGAQVGAALDVYIT